MVDEEHRQHADGHEEQRNTEHGVELAYQLVYRQQRGEHVVCEDDHYPERAVEAVWGEHCQQVGGIVYEYRAYEYHQHQGKHAHGILHAAAELAAYYLGL